MATALIIVDVQNDFISGSLPVPGGEEVAQRITTYLKAPGTHYDYILTTQDWHSFPGDHWSDTPDYVTSWPVHAKAGTKGAELHPVLQDLPVDAQFFKGATSAAYSGFEGTDWHVNLERWLQKAGVDAVDVVGLALDYCVAATALDAQRRGFTTRVLTDLTAAVTPDGGNLAKQELLEAGVALAGVVE